MARVTVKITGNRLPQIAAQLPDIADMIVNEQRGPEMVDVARRHSRVDTGEMRAGWRWQRAGEGEGELTNDVPHTIHNEYGTRNMSAAPMARPALAEVGPKIISDFQRLEWLIR